MIVNVADFFFCNNKNDDCEAVRVLLHIKL